MIRYETRNLIYYINRPIHEFYVESQNDRFSSWLLSNYTARCRSRSQPMNLNIDFEEYDEVME